MRIFVFLLFFLIFRVGESQIFYPSDFSHYEAYGSSGDEEIQNTPCGGTLTDPIGEIIHLEYSANENCEWTIMSSKPTHRFFLNIDDDFEFEKNYDYLIAEDVSTGQQLFNLTGNRSTALESSIPHDLESTGSPIKVKFRSDATISKKGFILAYQIVNDLGLECGINQMLFYSEGNITSIDPKDSVCSWSISPLDTVYDYIVMDFEKISDNCDIQAKFNYFTIEDEDGKHIVNCDENQPAPIYSLSHQVHVKLEKKPGDSGGLMGYYRALEFKSYGETCSSVNHDVCNPYHMLQCVEGVCTCHLPHDQMFYSEDEGQCISRFKTMCKFPHGVFQGKSVQSECINGTQCSSQGVCECSDAYFENSKGLCEFKHGYLGPCTRDSECKDQNHLTCMKGLCQCDEENGQVIDQDGARCVGALHQKCIDDVCLKNGNCLHDVGKNSSSCECSRGYAPSSDGTCGADHGYLCSAGNPCADLQFYCVEGECKCKNKSRKKYNHDLRICQSKLYGDCSNSNDCLKNMICSTKDESKYQNKYCLCSEGYIADHEGACHPSFGTVCDYYNYSNQESDNVCDPLTNLDCIDGICQCHDNLHSYSHEDRACLGNVGAICDFWTRICMPHLECISDSMYMRYGRCEVSNSSDSTESTTENTLDYLPKPDHDHVSMTTPMPDLYNEIIKSQNIKYGYGSEASKITTFVLIYFISYLILDN